MRQRIAHALGGIGYNESSGELGDFTATLRVIPISLIGIGIGVVAAYVALLLLKLIYFFTGISFYQRVTFSPVSPSGNHLGLWVLVIPVIGGVIVGLMGRYGSERIRGHGIPEALEAILLKGSRVEPRVAIFKPVSAAIAIGTGCPFGAEGPIIMTGGAVGSLVAQLFHLSDNERKTLLVAGAAAGMTGIFATPVASVILAVELLLFEWKPRSLIPVALASITAAAARSRLLGVGPLCPMPAHSVLFSVPTLWGCVAMGLAAGLFAMLLSNAIYALEDGFHRLPLNPMWWPAIGAIAVGVGGYFFPQGLGVGYEFISQLLQGKATVWLVAGILLIKSIMWLISLSSGNSGGILAPILMMGGALGVAGSYVFHSQDASFWALVTMAATFGAALGAPLTAIIFALELTHEINMLPPLLLTCIVSYAAAVLVLRRSIVTEKISRRGLHLSREYAVDPLEIMFTREVMRTSVVALPASATARELRDSLNLDHGKSGQWIYPVVDSNQIVQGVFTRRELQDMVAAGETSSKTLGQIVASKPQLVVAYPDEPLRVIVQRMAATGFTRLPVVDRRSEHRGHRHQRGSGDAAPKLLGLIGLPDLLKARVANLEAERKRERVLPLRIFPLRFRGPRQNTPAAS